MTYVIPRSLLVKLVVGLMLAVVFVITSVYINSKTNDYQLTLAPIYQGDQERRAIALTVNVYWGDQYLVPMLEIMAENNIKATFFIGGQWAEKSPELLTKISAAGHDIGSHGYSHPHPDQLSQAGNLREIKRSEKIINEITGRNINLFAPPYGEKGPAVLAATQEAGYQFILWSIDTIDWQRPAPEIIIERVITQAHNGAIVLMHPTAPTVQALPGIIEKLKNDGYQFVTVTELIQNIQGDD
ncbi:MAG: polysaccharide deacetylase family protein [Desulfotomaculum sp.]|nr:polysaccharide deacetylase family protein [Desulfotomaculum sp.]MCL0080824.1 polysaccharide deacetylase family protein [Peptococcaceae bacterium]